MRNIILCACPSADNALGILAACKKLPVKALLLRDDCANHSVLEDNLHVLHAQAPFTMPVAWGAEKAVLHGKQACPHYRAMPLPGPKGELPEVLEEHAWEVLYRMARELGKVTLVTLFSLTDVAVALFAHEDLPQYIEEIIVMGGTADVGNVSAYAEANLAEDAYAAEAVVRSGISVRAVGLDMARRYELPLEGVQAWPRAVFELLLTQPERYPYRGAAAHDLLTVAAANEPGRFSWNAYAANVEYKSTLCFGRLGLDIRRHCDDPKELWMAKQADEHILKDYLDAISAEQ